MNPALPRTPPFAFNNRRQHSVPARFTHFGPILTVVETIRRVCESGQIQWIGDVLFVTSFGLLALALAYPGSAGLMAIVCGHVALYLGFGLASGADAIAGKRFKPVRLVFLVLMFLFLAVAGPAVRAAGY